MKKSLLLILTAAVLTSCGTKAETSEKTPGAATAVTESTAEPTTEAATEAATEHETAPQNEVGFEGMEAVGAEAVKEGEYHISVDSSSSMFKIADCVLKVSGGKLTADLIIDSKSYDKLFMGTEEEAKSADSSECIGYTSNESGQSVFTVPVEALDKEIQCAALSAKKQEWYGRTLVFRADSLPDDAFSESRYTTLEELGLADGEYTVEVELEGGSGRATVASPAKLTVEDGKATAEIVWSSDKYDYMIVDGEKYLPVITDGSSVFEVPVAGFDHGMPVSADTTAMSVPYEIEYTLCFVSESIA